MSVRVELVADAVADLTGYVAGGNVKLFLAKLVHIEEAGKDAGQPLAGQLVNFRKVTVGDRNWRIIFHVDPGNTVATVWVTGDRDDSACYQDAVKRLQAMSGGRSEAKSLAAVMLRLLGDGDKKRKRKKQPAKRRSPWP